MLLIPIIYKLKAGDMKVNHQSMPSCTKGGTANGKKKQTQCSKKTSACIQNAQSKSQLQGYRFSDAFFRQKESPVIVQCSEWNELSESR